MANGNKAAKVSILGSYVYKNSQVDKIKIDNLNDSHAIMKGSIYIPNIKNTTANIIVHLFCFPSFVLPLFFS